MLLSWVVFCCASIHLLLPISSAVWHGPLKHYRLGSKVFYKDWSRAVRATASTSNLHTPHASLSSLRSGLAMSLLLSGVGLASLLRRLEDLFPLKVTKSRFAMSNFPD